MRKTEGNPPCKVEFLLFIWSRTWVKMCSQPGKCIDGCNSRKLYCKPSLWLYWILPFQHTESGSSSVQVYSVRSKGTLMLFKVCVLLYYLVAWVWCSPSCSLASLDLNVFLKWPHSPVKCVNKCACWSPRIRPEQQIYGETWTSNDVW